MKKTWIPLLVFLAAASASAEITRQNGEIVITLRFNEDTAIQRCIGYRYFRHECGSTPSACGQGASSGDPLPTVSRLISGDQRDVCTGNDTDAECEDKIAAAAGAIGLAKGHCAVADPGNVTAAEWVVCEQKAASRGLVPGSSVDEHEEVINGNTIMVGELPHFFGCLSFLDEKAGLPLEEARDEGRRRLSMDAKPPVDLSADQ